MLTLDEEKRHELWQLVVQEIERYARNVDRYPVSPQDSPKDIDAAISSFDFATGREPADVIRFLVDQLSRNQVHTPSAHYFGLFNPCPTDMSIFGDALAAAFNPQLAAASHNPFANIVERHLVQTIGQLFGYHPERIDGTFTSGGAEANHTALLCALSHRFVQFRNKGLRSLSVNPVVYVSAEAHHSVAKAARMCGLGTDAVREVPVDAQLRLDLKALDRILADDKKNGTEPVMIVATFGTTNAGAIDPIKALSDVAARHHAWYHVDAAWGGAVAFLPEHRALLDGIENADSITFDCHKWLSVPMSAGMLITRHTDVLDRTFRIVTDYMPKDESSELPADPYAHSMQWSRRFIGLKVFASLAAAGIPGYADVIRHQMRMGERLREGLAKAGWDVVSETPLPIVCFNGKTADQKSLSFLAGVASAVVGSGAAWISTTRVGQGTHVLRACITNYRTGEAEVDALVAAVSKARDSVSAALAG